MPEWIRRSRKKRYVSRLCDGTKEVVESENNNDSDSGR